MKRILKIWFALAAFYGAFVAWHQPLRGPLTEAEVSTAFGAYFDTLDQNEVAGAQAFLDFFLSDDGAPFYMVNLDALPELTPEVEAAERKYGTFMLPRLLSRASYPVLSADVIMGLSNSLGGDVAPFDRVVVVRYRSRRDFMHVVATSTFRDQLQYKVASLDGWYSAPSRISPTINPPLVLLVLLLVIGVVCTRKTPVSSRQTLQFSQRGGS